MNFNINKVHPNFVIRAYFFTFTRSDFDIGFKVLWFVHISYSGRCKRCIFEFSPGGWIIVMVPWTIPKYIYYSYKNLHKIQTQLGPLGKPCWVKRFYSAITQLRLGTPYLLCFIILALTIYLIHFTKSIGTFRAFEKLERFSIFLKLISKFS